MLLAGIGVLSWFGLEQRAMARARTLAAASVNATELEKNPVAGLKLAIAAAERSPTVEALEALTLALEYQRSLVILAHKDEVFGASFSHDGRRILTCGRNVAARVWDVASGQVVHALGEAGRDVRSCTFAPDDSAIVTLPAKGPPLLWDSATGRLRKRLEGHSDGATLVRFSPTGKKILSAHKDGIVRIWDTATGRLEKAVQVTDAGVRAAFLIAGDTALVVLAQHGVDNEIATLRGHTGWTHVVGFAPGDSTKILTIGSEDHTVRIWDISSPADRTASMKLGKLSPQELLDVARTKLPILGSSEPSQ